MKLRTAKRSSAPNERIPDRSADKPEVLPFRRSFSRMAYLALLLAGALAAAYHLVALMFVYTAAGIVHSGLSEIGADRTGTVLEICVDENVAVKKGTVLARIAVPGGEATVRLAMAAVERLQAQIAAERQRATARARQEASRLLEQASLFRDRCLGARSELLETSVLIRSHEARIDEISTSISALDQLNRQAIQAEHSYLGLRVQKLALEGQRDALGKRREVLEQRVSALMTETERLERAALAAGKDAIESSNVALLEAELAEARSRLELHRSLSSMEITAPEDGKVSWFQVRVGEVVVAGTPILQFVPDRAPVAVVYPGDQLEGFPVNEGVRIVGTGFRALGTVIGIAAADRERPRSLLKPYEKAVIGPAALIRVDEVQHGILRAGAEIEVNRTAVSPLRWLGF